jgi:nucleoside-diphosphate-sugar epimerase
MAKRIAIVGAAGLVGQNLIPRLMKTGRFSILAIDKHPTNTAILRGLHPDIEVIEADIAEAGPWEAALGDCDALVMLQAQIGGLDPEPFHRNNVMATERALAAARTGRCAYLAHISSSVVNSAAHDLYTESKKAQEALIAEADVRHVILRPTLMFGWFDRKHLGWLRRFMSRAPVFPIPGDGRYLRQPLYAGDFAAIISACLLKEIEGAYNISGLERIDYIDLIKLIKKVSGAKAAVVTIPYGVFWVLLKAYSLIDKDPPFTTAQLKALATPDLFEEIDWPNIFGIERTPLTKAMEETFLDPTYANVVLDF